VFFFLPWLHRYVRLFLRKADAWFRVARLQYPKDISDVDAACAVLQSEDVGFADRDETIALEDAAGLLFLEELKAVAKDAKCAVPGSNKSQLIAGLLKASKEQGGLLARGGQLKLQFDGRGNYVNREDHFMKKILQKTGATCFDSSHLASLSCLHAEKKVLVSDYRRR